MIHQAEQQTSAKADEYQVMVKVQHALFDNLWGYLNYRGRMQLQQATSITQSVRLDTLDWEDPGQEELDSVLFIVRQIEALLQNESLHGRETLSQRLLKDVLRQLWKYFLLSRIVTEQEATLTSYYHDQEWRENTLNPRSIIEDCKVVVHILRQNTRLLEVSEQVGSLEDLNQPLNKILTYLKNRSIKPRQSVAPTSDEEKKLLQELTESVPVQLDN